MDVDDTEIKVKVMNKIGRNRFFWPTVDDILRYSKDKIITLQDEHPWLLTKRHHEIPHNVWKDVEETIEDWIYVFVSLNHVFTDGKTFNLLKLTWASNFKMKWKL